MCPHAQHDLNPMDFSVWSLLKVKICSVAHSSVDGLKTSLLSEWAKAINKKNVILLVSNNKFTTSQITAV